MADTDKNDNSTLQLVPEALLKKRHDLDELKAKRAAQAITNPRITRKRVSDKSKVIRIIKPETIIMHARSRINSARRFNRVQKKGMQKRADKNSVVKTKFWDPVKEMEVPEPEATTEAEENKPDDTTKSNSDSKADALHKIPFKANSIGASTVFVILIRSAIHTTPRAVKRTLSSLRLRRLHEGVFVPYHSATRKMLHLVEPYVLYGIPSVEIISDLVRRRGFCRVKGKREPLADNNVIERELGDLGLICVEDLVQVLSSASTMVLDGGEEGFGKVAKFLWPFRLTPRKSKFQKKLLNMKDGKLYGDQGEAINGYIREML